MNALFTVIYRWRVKPEMEGEFRQIWHIRTEKIRAVKESYGSRLHREPDGMYCAIALWPSREAWESTAPALPGDSEDEATFRATLVTTLPVIAMEVVDDLWSLPSTCG
ncbi:MAG: hypothetical protein DLM50_07175 [Candidatus Meridianibacter frigidus]|nr:MAG: hypothetical protein DLM50_07175 [Candidatus Eremiobacteraeota bacterium]